MKILTPTQTQSISAAAQGDYYFNSISHPFECPAVSQVCLDTMLSFVDKANPALNLPKSGLGDVMDNCGGYAGFIAAGDCIDPVVSEIRVAAGLSAR